MSEQAIFQVTIIIMTPLADHLILTIRLQTNIEDTSRTNMESKPYSSMTAQPDVESSTWGDSGWESPYEICDSEIGGLNLTPLEQSWLRLCWQAATWSKH